MIQGVQRALASALQNASVLSEESDILNRPVSLTGDHVVS